MQGKTRCPYCNKDVIVKVPDGATGIQKTKCPNCGMNIKVNIQDEKFSWEEESPIHPWIKATPSSKPYIAGAMLIIVFILGIITGASILYGKEFLKGNAIYEGKVFDEYEKPLEGVKIYLINNASEQIAETNGKGVFLANLTVGKHRIELRKEGYETIIADIFVFPEKIKIKDKYIMERGNDTKKEKKLSARIMDIMPFIAFTIIILSFLPLIGSIFCFLRKYPAVAIVGAVFGIFTFGFLLGSLLSIAALILVIISKDEFGREAKY